MSKRRKARGSASVFGLALVAMLSFGVFAASAAQASPVWHINGKTFKEAGIEKAGYNLSYAESGSKLTIEIPGWNLTVDCKFPLGSGYLIGESSGTGKIEVNGCSIPSNKNCTVKVTPINVSLGLIQGGKTGVIETFTPVGSPMTSMKISGALCALNEYEETFNYEAGSLGVEVGPEATNLSLTGLSSTQIVASAGEELAYISLRDSFTQSLESGVKLGAW